MRPQSAPVTLWRGAFLWANDMSGSTAKAHRKELDKAHEAGFHRGIAAERAGSIRAARHLIATESSAIKCAAVDKFKTATNKLPLKQRAAIALRVLRGRL